MSTTHYISLPEAALRYSLSRQRMHQLVAEGRIRGARRNTSGNWEIPESCPEPGAPTEASRENARRANAYRIARKKVAET